MKIDRRNPRHWLFLALFAAHVLIARALRALRRPRGRRVVLYGHKLNGNLLALYRELERAPAGVEPPLQPPLQPVFLTLDPAYARELRAAGVRHQLAPAPGCAALLADARAIVTDHGLHAMELLLGARGLAFVDVWHGIPFKGFDGGDFRVQHRYDETWVASPLLRELYVTRFGFDAARVHATGYARTDRLVRGGGERDAARRRLGLPAGPVVLFAPTWQQDEPGRSPFPFGLDAAAFLRALVDACRPHGATVVVRAHLNSAPPDVAACDGLAFLPHATHPDTEELLLASDVLVCDWSSIAFDWLLLDRPTIFLDVPAPFRKGFSLGPEHRFGAVAGDLDALRARLAQALAQPQVWRAEFAARQAQARAVVYGGFADGRAGERCVARLARLLDGT